MLSCRTVRQPSVSSAQPTVAVTGISWPLEGATAGRTRTTTATIEPPLSATDRFVIGGDTQFVSPVVLSDELLIADGERRLHAFDLTNTQERWRVVLPGSFFSPTIVNGTVYIRVESGEDGFLVALNSQTGEERWQYRFPAVGSALGDVGGHVTSPVVVDDQVFVGAAQTINAFDKRTGGILWQFTSAEPIASSLAIVDGVVYFADFTHLYAIDGMTGAQLWQFDHPVMTLFFAPVVTDQTVVVADHHTLYALARTDGIPRWQRTFDQEIIPAAANAQEIYAKSVNGLWALDPADGTILWHYGVQNFVSLPAVTQAQVYIITRSDGGSQLRALARTDGKEIWKATDQPFSNSAPVAAQGAIYVRTTNGDVIGYRP